MPTLQEGSTGPVVSSLQTLLTNGAPGQWITTPQGIDGIGLNEGGRCRVQACARTGFGRMAAFMPRAPR